MQERGQFIRMQRWLSGERGGADTLSPGRRDLNRPGLPEVFRPWTVTSRSPVPPRRSSEAVGSAFFQG